MARKSLFTLLCLGALAWSAAASVHASGRSGYLGCLRTPALQVQGTIVDAAVATPSLSTLVVALQKAGLVETLQGPGPFTVYAPTNEAFGKLPGVILDPILADQELLTAVLTYHVSTGEHLDPRRTLIPREVSTLNGQTVFFNRGSDAPQINQSNVSCQFVSTSNGEVWLIDSVLLPQF